METFVHLLSGGVIPESAASSAPIAAAAEVLAPTGTSWRSEMQAEIDALKADVAKLREEMAALKTELGA